MKERVLYRIEFNGPDCRSRVHIWAATCQSETIIGKAIWQFRDEAGQQCGDVSADIVARISRHSESQTELVYVREDPAIVEAVA